MKRWLSFVVVMMLGFCRDSLAAGVFSVVNSGATSYLINSVANPTLNLVRGSNYTFNISASGHPFWIKSVRSTGTGNAFNTGVTGNGTDNGTLTFSVPTNAPNQLFYNCQFHGSMTGDIIITDPPVAPVEVVVGGFDLPGRVVFDQVSGATHYRVEWSSSAGGSWTTFTAAAESLDMIMPAGSGAVTAAVPMLYRVVATVTNSP